MRPESGRSVGCAVPAENRLRKEPNSAQSAGRDGAEPTCDRMGSTPEQQNMQLQLRKCEAPELFVYIFGGGHGAGQSVNFCIKPVAKRRKLCYYIIFSLSAANITSANRGHRERLATI